MIFISHGVLRKRDKRFISHAPMLDEQSYLAHLKGAYYVSLEDALRGLGDALTFDDGTYAALHGALLARRFGHPVSLFVNGWHVESHCPYFTYQLSAMLDSTSKTSCRLFDRTWSLKRVHDRRILRRALKEVYLRINSASGIGSLVDSVANELEVSSLAHDLRTITERDIRNAVDAGVSLQCHGWTHLNPLLFSRARLRRESILNQEWIRGVTGKASSSYAPAFGRISAFACGNKRNVVVAHSSRDAGAHAVGREDLAIHLQSKLPQDHPNSVAQMPEHSDLHAI
jgi:peptidoglycan/xylan/chitin deacetylase (PgdA/CDA1 family)